MRFFVESTFEGHRQVSLTERYTIFIEGLFVVSSVGPKYTPSLPPAGSLPRPALQHGRKASCSSTTTSLLDFALIR